MNDNLPINEKPIERILWLDVVRGMMIILMILGHNIQFASGSRMISERLYFSNTLFRLIYSFHMPCLTIISGYFLGFSIRKIGFWRNKFKTIIIPLFVWSTIPSLVALIKGIVEKQTITKSVKTVVTTFVCYYWFLWAILFSSIIVWLIHKYLKDSIIVYVIVIFALLFAPDFLNTSLWIFVFPFFIVGYLWNVKKIHIDWIEKNKYLVMGILIFLYVMLFLFYDTDSFVYTTGIAVKSFLQFMIDFYRFTIGLVGSVMIIWLTYCSYELLNKRVLKFLAYCGKMSLLFYFIDCLLNSYILPKLTKGFSLNYVVILIETIIITIICISSSWMIKKIPLMRRILLGSRQ